MLNPSSPEAVVCATIAHLYSTFLLLPRGAGSICGNCGAFASTGVRLYVTVRVTTSRTLTRLERLVFLSASQVLGDETAENGDWIDFALAGDRTAAGE
jgi:hypothetical protein